MAKTLPTSLSAYISNIFFLVFIQDDDKIAEEAYKQNWSADVKEVDNGKPLNFSQFREFLFTTRASITNRQLISQSFVVAPADAAGNTGQVAHTSHWSGVQQGKNIEGTIVSVLKIVLVPDAGQGKERRTVVTESFVLSVK